MVTPIEPALMTATAQVGAATITTCWKDTWNWLRRKYGYVKHMSKNFKKLEDKEADLLAKEKDVLKRLKNKSSTEEPTAECDLWRTRVENLKVGIVKLKEEYQRKPSTCCCGLCPYLALHELGKGIVKKTEEVTDLIEKRARITVMCKKSAPTPRRPKNDESIVRHRSLLSNESTLLDWLKEDQRLKKICVWGPPGIGKTTIMNLVHDKLVEDNTKPNQFDHIFWVTLTAENKLVEDTQEEIWRCLKLNDETESNRAKVIFDALKDKRYVLFLDVSFKIDPDQLEQVGILSNHHQQGKVVFARRDKCTGQTDEDLEVKTLSKEDAKDLFWGVVGSDLEKKQLKQYGEEIIRLYGGIPDVLISIAKYLAGKDNPSLWRDKMKELQSPSKEQWQEWEEYYKSLKLVHDEFLEDDYKHCLLYWAIFPSDEEIRLDYVIDCWTAQEFLKRSRSLHGEMRDRGHAILNKFAEKSLLEKGEKFGHLKMLFCFQKAALRIANENGQQFFAKNGEKIKNTEWILKQRVSLAGMYLSPLPNEPKCERMLTLLFHENSLEEIPKGFFGNMTDLQVLSLQERGIRGLPSSISRLKNLKGLFLNYCCQLVELPPQIKYLQNLEILVLHQTGICSLPSEIGQLTTLKCLRVSFQDNTIATTIEGSNVSTADSGNSKGCSRLSIPFCKKRNHTEKMMIPSGIITKLSNLEELSIDMCLKSARRWNQNAAEVATEITTLQKLTHIGLRFPHLEAFESFINNWDPEGLKSFTIFVGEPSNSTCASDLSDLIKCSSEKHLMFSDRDSQLLLDTFPKSVSKVLQHASSFELIGHTNLTLGLPADVLAKIETCVIEECNKMQNIVVGSNNPAVIGFRSLGKLHMKKLSSLEHVWKGTIASFHELTTLTLKECNCVTILFTLEMSLQLSKLQTLQVEDCEMIKKIIDTQRKANKPIAFPMLKNFKLYNLPNLSCVCDAALSLPSLKTMLVKECDELIGLPDMLGEASELKTFQCEEVWWSKQAWPDNVKSVTRFLSATSADTMDDDMLKKAKAKAKAKGKGIASSEPTTKKKMQQGTLPVSRGGVVIREPTPVASTPTYPPLPRPPSTVASTSSARPVTATPSPGNNLKADGGPSSAPIPNTTLIPSGPGQEPAIGRIIRNHTAPSTPPTNVDEAGPSTLSSLEITEEQEATNNNELRQRHIPMVEDADGTQRAKLQIPPEVTIKRMEERMKQLASNCMSWLNWSNSRLNEE